VPAGTTADNYDFHGMLEKVAGVPFQVDFDHIGFWDLRVMVAKHYGKGRMFIAGDAAHQHPPYGGFGLNTGLEDATNLAWKLAATLQGWGGQGLLESYSEERRPIFAETGEDVIAAGIDRDAVFLASHDPKDGQAEFEQAWKEHAESRGRPYNPHYQGSAVIEGPAGAPISIHAPLSLKAEAGFHLAPRTLTSGHNVYEELGSGFTLLALGADDAAVAAFESAAKASGIPLKVIRDSFDDSRGAYEARLVLVRPDQYVVWAGDEAPQDPAKILSRVTGTASKVGSGT
jgi:hypothetical protein